MALTLVRKLRPMIIGSVSGWLMLAGMMARPRAISSRTNSGVISFGMLAPKLLPSASARAAQIFARGDEFHFLGDEALARIVKLGDVRARLGAQRLDARRGRTAAPRAARRGFRPSSSGLRARPSYSSTSPRARIQSRRRRGQALLDIDGDGIIRIRTGCVVQPHRRLAARQRHFAERHAVHHQLARAGQRAARDLQRILELRMGLFI